MYMNCHAASLKKYFMYQNIEVKYISTYGNIFQYNKEEKKFLWELNEILLILLKMQMY